MSTTKVKLDHRLGDLFYAITLLTTVGYVTFVVMIPWKDKWGTPDCIVIVSLTKNNGQSSEGTLRVLFRNHVEL